MGGLWRGRVTWRPVEKDAARMGGAEVAKQLSVRERQLDQLAHI